MPVQKVQSLKQAVELIKVHQDELKSLGVVSLSVFGSFAKEEFNEESDVDVVIEPDYKKPFTLFSLIRVKLFLEETLGRKVDVTTRNSLKEEIKKAITEVKVF